MKHFYQDKGEISMRIVDWIVNRVLSKWFLKKNRLKLAEVSPISRSIWLAINNTERDRSNKFR